MYKRLIFRYHVYFVTTLHLTKQATKSPVYRGPRGDFHKQSFVWGALECKIGSKGFVKSSDVRFQEKNVYEEIYVSVPITDTGGQVE